MFASHTVNAKGKGKVIKRYRHEDVKTLLAALKQLCDKGLARLKDGVTLAALQAPADAQTDLETMASSSAFCEAAGYTTRRTRRLFLPDSRL